MSDDSGCDDDGSDSGSATRGGGGSGSFPDLSVLRRAMRWETFALLAVLLILVTLAS
ncbi:hypothetical protein Spla01_06890 [Streptomyces platensis]|uniref:Uncharacterized protein n=1 Tax=Streptomyces platensis TaxID=58346 RepID=A0ABX3XNY6_STRPT|nr:hypothetical protein [Streptomyces platensis]OSY38564.1 hypothetical protein BG653_06058 [Streptomyces platensis]